MTEVSSLTLTTPAVLKSRLRAAMETESWRYGRVSQDHLIAIVARTLAYQDCVAIVQAGDAFTVAWRHAALRRIRTLARPSPAIARRTARYRPAWLYQP